MKRSDFKNLSLYSFLGKRGLHKTKGFIDHDMILTDSDIEEILEIVGGRKETKARIRANLKSGTVQLLSNVEKMRFEESIGWQFCAGQSYPDEINRLRKVLAA